MSTILAVDTATQACSVALLHAGNSFCRTETTPRSHTKTLLPMIDKLLAEAAIGVSQLDALTFTNGPGSFTGIRIGFGVIQGLAFGIKKPVIPIGSLHLLAATAVREKAITDKAVILPAFDARMDEMYGAAFEFANHQLTPIEEVFLRSPEDAYPQGTYDSPTLAVGDGWHYGERIAHQPETVDTELLPDAQDLLPIAEQQLEQGQAIPIDKVELRYLRDHVSWKKRQRLRA